MREKEYVNNFWCNFSLNFFLNLFLNFFGIYFSSLRPIACEIIHYLLLYRIRNVQSLRFHLIGLTLFVNNFRMQKYIDRSPCDCRQPTAFKWFWEKSVKNHVHAVDHSNRNVYTYSVSAFMKWVFSPFCMFIGEPNTDSISKRTQWNMRMD